MLIDVRPDHLDIVRRILRQYVPQAHIWAFGSRAKWNARDISDLDLCIDNGARLSFERMGLLEEAFANSTLPYKVDVVDMHSISDSFRQMIERDKVALPVEEKQVGGVPEGWREVALSEAIEIVTEKTPSTSIAIHNYVSTDNMLVDRGGVVEATSIPDVEKFNSYLPDDTLFSNIRTYFKKVWLADRQGGASPDVLILRTRNKKVLLSRYLYYIVSNQEFIDFTVLTSKGAKMPRGDKTAILRHSIALPPLPEQKAIAAILGALDDKIEANRRMNATLEGIARALFKSWFVDFDPVRAKAEGRPSGLPADLDALFPASFTDSPLGAIPAGWEAMPIGDAVTAVGGGTPSTSNPAYWEGGIYHWATPKDLASLGSSVLLATERQITDAGLGVISSGLLPAGSVLMSSRAPIGYIAVNVVPVAINQGFIGIICDKSLPYLYVWQWLHENMDAIKGRANGSTFQEISKSNFRPLLAVIPPQVILTAYMQAALPVWDKIVIIEKERKTLTTLRDTLLPKLISGQIRVKDAEKLVEGAT